uniref:Enolase-phosphatase E1 n=1 Tax=Candidatus Kentrum sp. LPFa TaxID=2126335 RepID=A0A450XE53_9GAMM|nr:MAG: enolase-phosphatase E1 [Candidatus Kentron sp. LPFa]VFK27567.1 MAG: enolase-phosphatase E1 [Candidatus Kentron sp. LPFa]
MIKAILTDIEGTTTSISFVFHVLFPYARQHMAQFVAEHGGEPAVRTELRAVAKEVGRSLDDDEVVEILERWIDEDRKATPLKSLQGMVWQRGYRRGDFTGHVYEDALRNLRRWHGVGLGLYVYSSGSVQAQKLLFGYSDAGDLTPLFSGYFDTRVGHKHEAASYTAIADRIGLAPNGILFLSDIERELDAARESGMATCQVVRDGKPIADLSHPQVSDFDSIELK